MSSRVLANKIAVNPEAAEILGEPESAVLVELSRIRYVNGVQYSITRDGLLGRSAWGARDFSEGRGMRSEEKYAGAETDSS